jgi:hypothetical protein
MRIYLLALAGILGLAAAACGDSESPTAFVPEGEDSAATAGPGTEEEHPSGRRCLAPGFASAEHRVFQDDTATGSRPIQPIVFCGRVTIAGEAALDGTLVEAAAEGETCATTVTRDGLYWLDLPLLRCPKGSTAELTFLVDGRPAKTLSGFGHVHYQDLIVGQSQ